MAVIVGFITALATTLVYIPSTIHTIMKFRSGVSCFLPTAQPKHCGILFFPTSNGVPSLILHSAVFFSNTLHDIFFHYFAQVIPSLRDPNFIKYRTGLQDMAYLIGGMFWGLLISSLGMIVLVAGLVFFLTWHGEHTHWHLLILLSSSRSDVPDPVMRTLSGQFSQPFSGAGPRCTR